MILHRQARQFAIVIAGISLSGCAALNGYPAQPDSISTTIASLDDATLKSLVAEYNTTTATADRKKAIRNQILFSDLTQIDGKFDAFKINLNTQSNLLSIGTDATSLLLAGLGATVGDVATKASLAAASAGVIGVKASIDKDVLYQKTISALVTEMEAQRSQVYARIITSMNSDVGKYPLEAAGKDIQDYYQAGTLVNAIQGVNDSASAKAKDAQVQVSAALSANYNYTDLSKKIEAFWMPDGKTVNTTNQTNLKNCMTQSNVAGSIPFLINGGTETDKSAVISCLKL